MIRLPIQIPTRFVHMPGGGGAITIDLRDRMTDFLLMVRAFWAYRTSPDIH